MLLSVQRRRILSESQHCARSNASDYLQWDLDDIVLDYQRFHKTVDVPDDGCDEKVELGNYLLFRLISKYSFMLIPQQRYVHRNLCHPIAENKTRVIENAELKELPISARKHIEVVVEHCIACQLNQESLLWFCFPFGNPFMEGLTINCLLEL